MDASALPSQPPAENFLAGTGDAKADRLGVALSVICAIHCAVTPPLLLILPTFGKAWAHPATHWGMAIFIVPLALFMMSKGYKRHRRRWIIAVGALGISLVLLGAAAPYVTDAPPAAIATAPAEVSCTDPCCPSIVTKADGKQRLHIPAASILTTAGGLFLIVTHVGNLCRCRGCKK